MKRAAAVLIAAALAASCAAHAPAPSEAPLRILRVCADPNNLPFSNQAGEGYENKLAELIARDLGARLEYTWWAQRRGYVRHTLNAGQCDLVPGTAAGVDMMATTRPYYRSSYVFLTRRDRHLEFSSLDDPRLRTLTIGVQMIGNDATNTPPAQALARRGITDNVRGFMIYGDYAQANPAAAIVDAVARGDIDVALVWGPLAGYFASRESVALNLSPVAPALDEGRWPMVFDVAMGVRRGDAALLAEVGTVLDREQSSIDAILASYGVPLVSVDAQRLSATAPR